MKSYESLKSLVSSMEADVQKHVDGNSSAGTRVRKALQEVKKISQTMRTEVQEAKNKGK